MYKKFDEIFEDVTKLGTKVKTDEYHSSGKHQIIDQGQEIVAGYTDLEKGLFEDVPAIIFGDHTRIIKYVDQPFFLGADGVKVLRSRLEAANYRYLYYALKNVKIPNTGYNRHFKWLKTAQIKWPNAETQSDIVAVLDRISKIIKYRQRQLQKLDELVKARFVELFGDLANPSCLWETIKLADACASADDIKCGPFGTQLGKGEYVDSGVAVWEIPQINAAFKACPTHFITEEKATQLKAYSLVPGDIAMSRKGNVGRCAIFPDEYVDGIIHSDVLRIRVNEQKVNPVFMMYQLHFSSAVINQIEMVSSGAIMAGVNVTKLKQIYVHIPPKKLQDQFVSFVKQTDKSKVAVQKALDEAQLLFDSLMQKYFG